MTIMTRYDSTFREPPWVMGSPREVMDWMDASHPNKKKKDGHKFEKQFLKNLHIKFDFDVEKRIVKSNCIFCRVVGLNEVEEDFDLLHTTELILRGLAKAKFKNTAKIVVDGNTLYNRPQNKSDLRQTIGIINDFSKEIKEGKGIEITAILSDVKKCTAVIKVKKIHSTKEHSVDIQIKGYVNSNVYHTFLNYLNEKIGIKEKI